MITKDMLEAVSSRSDLLARRYYFFEKEDLMQEGYMLLMDLDKKDLTDQQKHKAINNKFSNLERDAQRRQKIERNASSFEVEPDAPQVAENIEEALAREEITQHLFKRLSVKERMVVEWLSQGRTIDMIAKDLGVKRDRAQRVITKIIAKRKEIEDETGPKYS